MFYQCVWKLKKISEWYNRLRNLLLPIEFSLVTKQFLNMDKRINEGESKITWINKAEAEDYVNKLYTDTEVLYNAIFTANNNFLNIQKLIETWYRCPLFERKDKKTDTLLHLEDKTERLNKRYAEIKATGEQINAILQENKILFEADTNSEQWKDYVEYIDQIVINGLFNVIKCSLSYLIENTDEHSVQAPFFEIFMELNGQEITFTPATDKSVFGNFLSIFYDLTVDIFNLAKNIPRITMKKDKKDYEALMKEIDELSLMNEIIWQRSEEALTALTNFVSTFKNYAFLWEVDKEALLQEFLIYGNSQFIEDMSEEIEPVPSPPTLELFEKEIENYEDLWKEVEALDNYVILKGWLRVDMHRFKYGLLNVIRKWGLMFKTHLANNLTSSLNDLENFLKDSEIGLSQHIEEGDYTTLVSVLGYLKAVKDRQEITDEMFQPLQKSVELLQNYKLQISEDTLTKLQDLPEQWTKIKKKSNLVKQYLQPLLTKETSNVRHKYAKFETKQIEYREKFLQSSVFLATCEIPLEICDELDKDIIQLKTEMEQLNSHAALLEISPPEFKQLSLCQKELNLLRNVWKYTLELNDIFQTWKKTPWLKVVVEDMDLECKKFNKEIRFMDKEIKGWDVYKDLEAKIKNMMISLRAVGELQNPAIRERHWFQLMTATKVKFVMTSSTTLADLLELNLHKYEEEVHQIVDKAVKEMAMEKTLKELNNTWQKTVFEYEIHPKTGCTLIKPSEILIETLEENQVILQNMLTSKHNEYFLSAIAEFQKKLSNADQIINILFDVQRTWCNLQSIFIGTEDIRMQLPQDTARFDELDQEFKCLLQELMKSANVITVTSQKGLYENLEKLKTELTLCEKALAEYLETKRLIFPRFYFISFVDLLDILSNGNSPILVAKHLTKLFDSLSKLKFSSDNENTDKMQKSAVGMYSKDGEYVPFSDSCDCDGVVEVWLNHLLDHMRATVRFYLTEAVSTYEDRPRESWIFNYPAQVALTANQIWWATEVNLAFAKLEEGYENALKEYNKKQHQQLNSLIGLLLGSLKSGDRQKVMTICTIDVHSRDVVAKMIAHKVESSSEFMWQSQLRHYWNAKKADCQVNICDAEFQYAYEYLGNTTRLVITPLTDRCYITLTQSLHLFMGGAPAGPAGTGKTETTKDLGRALGCMVYVFNCSEQMDYRSCGNIYKGLAQTGAWGCFDEFNRISIEVLSVVAVQVEFCFT
ncbi:dynein beta chain, ciliary-like, partial [Centruroides sculpturatus]|uniref:dynein beta chain, ciliary-like n=1 Tax=Centruroides sculpturatus TaxID=218467 RepID=UPI000C6D0517